MTGPTTIASLDDGPLRGKTISVDVIEGRPPKTIDVTGEDQATYRYCLSDWVQTGPTAAYSFLYPVGPPHR